MWGGGNLLASFNVCVLAFSVLALGFYFSIFDFLNLAKLGIFDNVPNLLILFVLGFLQLTI